MQNDVKEPYDLIFLALFNVPLICARPISTYLRGKYLFHAALKILANLFFLDLFMKSMIYDFVKMVPNNKYIDTKIVNTSNEIYIFLMDTIMIFKLVLFVF